MDLSHVHYMFNILQQLCGSVSLSAHLLVVDTWTTKCWRWCKLVDYLAVKSHDRSKLKFYWMHFVYLLFALNMLTRIRERKINVAMGKWASNEVKILCFWNIHWNILEKQRTGEGGGGGELLRQTGKIK